jgi:hypothetical protein
LEFVGSETSNGLEAPAMATAFQVDYRRKAEAEEAQKLGRHWRQCVYMEYMCIYIYIVYVCVYIILYTHITPMKASSKIILGFRDEM